MIDYFKSVCPGTIHMGILAKLYSRKSWDSIRGTHDFSHPKRCHPILKLESIDKGEYYGLCKYHVRHFPSSRYFTFKKITY